MDVVGDVLGDVLGEIFGDVLGDFSLILYFAMGGKRNMELKSGY